jgi:DNA polymerase-1
LGHTRRHALAALRRSTILGIAYVGWSQQEFGIAAALSGDQMMMEAYRSGDPYLSFAKQANAAPSDATKASHSAVREQFKACVLAVQYGMGADALAQRIGQPPIRAAPILPARDGSWFIMATSDNH